MYKKVKTFIQDSQMIKEGMCILAGVSGGGDSMAMLSFLERYQAEKKFDLCVVHIHHGIRGKEADRDQELVEKTCRKWKIPYKCYFFDVPSLAKEWKTGVEEAGRIVRKKAFEEEKKRLQTANVRIALAHNQDDLTETLLHNLCRGSGLRGLSSMRPVSGEIIRPVLCLKREEIDNYLIENEIPYETDSTNLSDEYTRNKIRHRVLPVLEECINSRACAHIAETSRVLAMAEDYFTELSQKLLDQCRKTEEGILLEPPFLEEKEIIQRYVIMEAFLRLSGRRKDFQAIHVEAVLELFGNQVGSRCSLPYGLQGIRKYEGVLLAVKEKIFQSSVWNEVWKLIPGEELLCPMGNFQTKIFSFTNQKIPEKTYTKWLNYDKIKYDLCVRTRRPGDFLAIDEKGSRKKISRCMIDEKIPQKDRDGIPLLVCGEEVLWMIGGRINERYKITPNTKYVLEVRYQGGDRNE